MSLPTCAVVCNVFDDSGAPVSGATITAKLNRYEVYNGYVVPQTIQGTTNDSGTVTLHLWPNALGSTESSYVVKIAAPNGKNLTTTAQVPNVTTMPLHLIANMPPYDGKPDGQLVIDEAIVAGATAVAAATEAAASATAAATSATSAATSATSASTSASTATTKASEASTSATSAANSATTASTQAATATTKAAQASASATAASEFATTATTKASEAASSATSASTSATTATTKASEAATSAASASASQSAAAGSATAASNSATAAAGSATAAASSATSASTSASTATTKASEASVSATNAANSATAAASSATSASNSASTATTKASEAANSATTATTKASEASTSASNAATSATNAASSATAAATSATSAQASSTSASGYASTAQTQAGIATTKANEAAASAAAAADSAAVASSGGIRFDVAQSLTSGQKAQARSNIGVFLGVADGVATLGSDGKVPSAQLPSYVDDVIEAANYVSLPGTGETGKIYVTLDNNKTYRWSGSDYVEISASPGSTDAVAEGSTNLYFTNARARQAISVSGGLSYDSATGVLTGPDLSGYLTSATAAATYQTVSGMSSYLTTSAAAATYQTQDAMSSYLTSATAASTYVPLTGASITGAVNVSGNFGLGTTSPGRKFHLEGGRAIFRPASEQYAINIAYNSGTDGVWLGSPEANTFSVFNDAGSEMWRVTPSGVTIPGSGARITGDFSNATAANRVMFQTSTANGNTTVSAIPNGTGITAVFRAYNSSDPANAGNITVQASNTEARIDAQITGTGTYLPMTFYTGGSERARFSTAGGFSVGTTADAGAGGIYATGTVIANYSDERLKTKLGKIESALDKICAIDTFYYEANETAQALGYKAERELGVSAQSVQAVFPEVVVPAPVDAQYLTVRYERLVAPIIEAIKELRAEVKALKGE